MDIRILDDELVNSLNLVGLQKLCSRFRLESSGSRSVLIARILEARNTALESSSQNDSAQANSNNIAESQQNQSAEIQTSPEVNTLSQNNTVTNTVSQPTVDLTQPSRKRRRSDITSGYNSSISIDAEVEKHLKEYGLDNSITFKNSREKYEAESLQTIAKHIVRAVVLLNNDDGNECAATLGDAIEAISSRIGLLKVVDESDGNWTLAKRDAK